MTGSSRRPLARVATLARQPWSRKKLTAEAIWELAKARLAVRRRGQYGALDRFAARSADVVTPMPDSPLSRDIGWAIHAASSTLPWNTLCLTQAIAAARMLSRRDRPWVIHVGLARDEEELIAHAWVTCGQRVVVGGAEVNRYARLVSYAPK